MLVKINTSDYEWIKRHAADDPVFYGTDIKGVVYFTATVDVASVERTTFAGTDMIRVDLGDDAPADHNRHAMYPASYLMKVVVSDDLRA